MATFKIIVTTIFILITIFLLVDTAFTILEIHYAIKKNIKYEKRIGSEIFLILLWGFCLASLMLL